MAGHQAAHHHTFNNAAGDNLDSRNDVIPDVFSIVAQESLLDTAQPAFKHLIKVLASRFPGHLGGLYRYGDELYLALSTFIEYHSLKSLEGSFAEHFYGLKRVSADGKVLTSRLKFLNLLLLVGFPYVRRKSQLLYDAKSIEVADGVLQGQDVISRMERALVAMYPYLHMAWSGLVFSYFLRFLFRYTDVHSPLLKLCRTKLVPLSLSDMVEAPTVSWSQVLNERTLKDKLVFIMSKTASSLPHFAFQTFSMGVFFLQFLQWYSNYSQDEGESQAMSTASTIPPPKLPSDARSADRLVCPLCMKTRTNSTALSTSGYVFCYPCIHRYVEQHGKCPVTGFTAKVEHLIKLYTPDT